MNDVPELTPTVADGLEQTILEQFALELAEKWGCNLSDPIPGLDEDGQSYLERVASCGEYSINYKACSGDQRSDRPLFERAEFSDRHYKLIVILERASASFAARNVISLIDYDVIEKAQKAVPEGSESPVTMGAMKGTRYHFSDGKYAINFARSLLTEP